MYPKIKIEFMDPENSNTRLTYQNALSQVNVSNASQVFVPNNNNFSKRGFQLSSAHDAIICALNGQYTYFSSDGYNGYLASYSSGQNVLIRFYVYNNIPTNLYITFDPSSGEYAEIFTISNNQNNNVITVSNNRYVTARVNIASLNVTPGVLLTLTILKWCKTNKSAKVTNIGTQVPVYESSGATLISFKCSENLMDSDLSVTPGICEQYANIQIYDREEFFRCRALENALTQDAQVTLSVVLSGNTERILGTYLVSDWDINSNSSRILINCRDKSYILSKINIQRSDVSTRSVDTLLNIMFSSAANIPWEYIDSATQLRCVNMFIPNCWWLASDLYTLLNKICAVGMLRIYWKIDKFVVGRCV